MKKSTTSAKRIKTGKIVEIIGLLTVKRTWIYFGLMAVLYLFSLFGGMFATATFTYAEF